MTYEIQIPEGVQGCVYKLWYSGKYVVIKCKTIVRSKENLQVGLKYFEKNTPKGRKEEDLFYDLYDYVINNPGGGFRVEILMKSDNPFELLKSEHMELLIARGDPRCLNNDFSPYIPRFTQINGKKSWINRGYYLNYMNWKRKFANQRMIQ